jgi:hypothetical protein
MVLEKLLSLLSLEENNQVIVAWLVVCPEELLLFPSFEGSYFHPSLMANGVFR